MLMRPVSMPTMLNSSASATRKMRPTPRLWKWLASPNSVAAWAGATVSCGLPVYCPFCNRCASPIFFDVAATPRLDSSWVQPSANIWRQSAQPGAAYPEAVPRFEQNPPQAG